MDEVIRQYNFDEAPMPAPWDTYTVMFATDAGTGERFVGIAFICEIVGLNPDAQTRMLRKATETPLATEEDEARFVLAPGAIRKINMRPRSDAKARAGYRDQVCILHTEIAWWLSHIPPHKIKDVHARTHIEEFQQAVKFAAHLIYWHRQPALTLPGGQQRQIASNASCQHDVPCPWCGKWHRVSTENGETACERLA